MTLRIAAVAGIAVALIAAACAGNGDGNVKPTLAVPDATRTADPLALCFDASALPKGFTLENELVLDNAEQTTAEEAELYDEWGRVSGGRRTFSAQDRPLATAGLARTPLLDGRFDSVSCTVELYQDARGAGQAFAGTGFHGPLVGGALDRGTFGLVASPEIGAESRQYLSVHAVISASDVLFRDGNALARVHVQAPSSSFPGMEKTGLTAEAARLALVLLNRLERDSTR